MYNYHPGVRFMYSTVANNNCRTRASKKKLLPFSRLYIYIILYCMIETSTNYLDIFEAHNDIYYKKQLHAALITDIFSSRSLIKKFKISIRSRYAVNRINRRIGRQNFHWYTRQRRTSRFNANVISIRDRNFISGLMRRRHYIMLTNRFRRFYEMYHDTL